MTQKQRFTRERLDVAKLQERVRRGGLVKPIKIGEAIGRLKERYPRVARYYAIEYHPEMKKLTCNLDQAKRGKAEKLDGGYILKSDRNDLSADEVWRFYTLLTRAENAFRSMKSPLWMRPIHHQREERVETHIFLSVLAYPFWWRSRRRCWIRGCLPHGPRFGRRSGRIRSARWCCQPTADRYCASGGRRPQSPSTLRCTNS